MPLHDFVCSKCNTEFEELVPQNVSVVPCVECGKPAKIIFKEAPKTFNVIVPDYPGSKRLKAGYVHSHGDRPATRTTGKGWDSSAE